VPRPAGLTAPPPGWPRRFPSRLHDEAVAARLGLWLGVGFLVCFATGLVSHAVQHPAWWFTWPTRPVNLYRLTQGAHVLTGLACIPLLLAKLWVVYPSFWAWPPARSVLHGLERAALLPLVAGSLFQLFTGLANIAYWYPFAFFFPRAHYWTAWVTIGALLVHVAAKWARIRSGLAAPEPVAEPGELSRRGFLASVGVAIGLVVATTVGSTVRPLRSLALLAPRRPDIGPQGLPVNKSAVAARVVDRALDPAYRLHVDGPDALSMSYADLGALPQHTAALPIACVEGWSADATWTGVRVRDLLARAGVPRDAQVRVESLQPRGVYRTSLLLPHQWRDPLCLLALRLDDATLHVDHGFPCRLIAPNRPGVMNTKWVGRLVAL
jgi:DMSO/TMAO reductase YedYZ molybdopterin-dependent catalytic subunit